MGVDQILADLNQDMGQAPGHGMLEQGVTVAIARRIGLIVADRNTLRPQPRHQGPCQTRIGVPEDADLPRPLHAFDHRGKAVHGHDSRPGRRAARDQGVQGALDCIVIGPVEGVDTGLDISGREVPVPSREFVRALYRAQIEAAKEVQWSAVSDPAFVPPDPLPDVEAVLRPALLRIGDRIARLLIDLPPGLERDTVRGAARDALRTPRLSVARRRAIADAIADLSRAGADALAIRSGSAPEPAPRR